MLTHEITFASLINGHSKKFPENEALVSEGMSFTYRQMQQSVNAFASMLIDKGVKSGDHVALWAYNSAQWVIAMHGIIKAGAVAVLLNYSLPAKELEQLVKYTEVSFIVYGNNRETRIDENAGKKMAEKTGISAEKLIDLSSVDFKELSKQTLSSDTLEILSEFEKNDDPHRTAVIIFTTGTTAMPKAVMLSQYSLLNDAIGYGERYKNSHGKKCLVSIPLFHSFGLLVCNVYLIDAATVYLHEIIKPNVISKIVGENKISDMVSVGSVYLGLVEEPDFDINLLPNIRLCLIGGGFSTPVQMMRLESAFSHGIFLNGYGQTESSPALSLVSPDDKIEKRANTVGRPLDGAELKIWNKESGFLNQGEIGEVVARGYYLMNGYFKLPKEQQAIDDEGWLHTGDLGFIDEEGYLHLTGRIKDIIIKSGENILPAEIEKEICKNEGVREVKVFGTPNYLTGEAVQACVVMNKGFTFDVDDIKQRLKGKISSFKIPENIFEFESFPVNANGKLDQRTLKDIVIRKTFAAFFNEMLCKEGIYIGSMVIPNISFMENSVSQFVKSIAQKLNFSDTRIEHMCKSVSAMFMERISSSCNDMWELSIKIKLLKKSLRIEFSDSGERYFSDKKPLSNESASTILKYVDNFSIVSGEKDKNVYCIDFNYDYDFDAADFIISGGN